ncbi:hypothetical protein ASC66_06485 [Leifsonia sp. Root4]|uniref:DUF1801 domain-containing protein n=1 Tax=Leifsonia sp. Root4 TaxID=1736525 RepID=UPI0006FDDB78|nr:DUF1801 domain-containing protein [Leifsonia sp. Root4]KQW06175.1 hypothetical protein ASC66_06485 [Leifsonia sp. Root4]
MPATLDEFIAELDAPAREIAESLRAIIDDAVPGATGQVWHGHPVWLDGKNPIAGFKPYPRWTTFMIWNGSPITDASGRLESGARMSTLKLSGTDDIDAALFADWLKQATATA